MATMSVAQTNTDPELEAQRVRLEMRQIRRELGQEVEDLVEQAERLMDWRYYVNRYPWATVGAAALLGYFIVPRRSVTLPTDEHTLSRLAEHIPIMMQKPEPKRPSLFSNLVSSAGNMAWKAALAYATQQVGKVLGEKVAAAQTQEAPHGQPTG